MIECNPTCGKYSNQIAGTKTIFNIGMGKYQKQRANENCDAMIQTLRAQTHKPYHNILYEYAEA